jgi:cytochrome P450
MKLTSLISVSPIIRDQDRTADPKAVRDNTLSKTCAMMRAGLGTTVNHACGTLSYMVSTPGIFDGAAHEIRERFTKAEDITAAPTADLVDFKACIEEGLRMYHRPVVGTIPRVVPEGGATICGRFVPRKISVGIHPWSTYRSERNFKNTDAY